MKTIIAGFRGCTKFSVLWRALDNCSWNPTSIVSGRAKGADTLGEQYARDCDLPIEYYVPDWEKYGRSAGMIRNLEMARNAEACIVLWDGYSKGSANMIETARRCGLATHVELYD